MSKKTMTKDCPSCALMELTLDDKFVCNWGNYKRKKYLSPPKGRVKTCRLEK